ncbi:MAG TPA: SDR family NAD(P)-dependent oxidoreductase, partial [Jatrophihabitantaceae bacterium]|nr:SDR family NAD(P)-dependent oxidoreductase [Jatrophihabitantaceae bacterium]
MELSGKVAFVTGGGNGMGRGYCLGLSGAGASVVVTDINLEAAESVAEDIRRAGGVALAARCDVGSQSDIDAAVAAASDAYGGVDILVNNAGLHLTKWTGPFASFTADELRALFDVNVMGVIAMTMACRPAMTQRGGGVIVNIASTSGYLSTTPYGVTKLAVRGLTVALAKELGSSNIRVNGIAPGIIYTDSALAQLGEEGLA